MKFKIPALILAVAVVCGCAPAPPVPELTGRLAGLRLGDPLQYENLTVIPVFSDNPDSRDQLVPLETALENKWLEIKEIESGEVSRVVLNNNSDKKIFILSGQVITGCKQDRIIAGDRIIAPGQRDIDLDVFCVEAGRWTAESAGFYTKKNMGTAGLREKAQRKEDASQTEIWDEIASKNAKLGVATDSGAYQDAYDQAEIKASLARYNEHLARALDRDAVGVVVGVGGALKSVDVFANATLFRHYWPSILKASSLDAVSSDKKGSLSREDAQRLLAGAGDKEFTKTDQKDDSRAAVYLDEKINSNDIETGGQRVHFSLFPVETRQRERRQEMRRNDDRIDFEQPLNNQLKMEE